MQFFLSSSICVQNMCPDMGYWATKNCWQTYGQKGSKSTNNTMGLWNTDAPKIMGYKWPWPWTTDLPSIIDHLHNDLYKYYQVGVNGIKHSPLIDCTSCWRTTCENVIQMLYTEIHNYTHCWSGTFSLVIYKYRANVFSTCKTTLHDFKISFPTTRRYSYE